MPLSMKKIFLWGLTLLFATLIFILSSQNDKVSNSVSQSVTEQIVEKGEALQHSDAPLTKTEFSVIHELIRSFAHFTLFLLFAFSLFLLIQSYKIRLSILLSLTISIVYALTDEIHQVFVPGRSFEVIDLIKDWSGSIIGMCFAVLFLYVIRKQKKKQDKGGAL